MAVDDRSEAIVKTFAVKPKLKPTTNKSTPTPESKYWKSFKPKQTQTLVSSITSLSFSPTAPHDIAATHSATVTIFSSQTLEPKSTISSFKDTATSACFRSDGQLIAAGSYSVATAGGNNVKIWDVIGGGKLLHSMESHNKTVTSLCVGKIGKDSGEFSNQYRILSVSLDGYTKVFDYSTLKITSSIRYPSSLMSVAFSPDCTTRVIGTSNGILYAGKRKTDENLGSVKSEWGKYVGFGAIDEPEKRVLRPSYFRYFHRGQNEKPSKGDYLIMRPKKVKLAEHDKLLKKFHHKEALVSALRAKNPENIVAVMEELVSRKKLLMCVSNLGMEELGLLLSFLQRYSTKPRYAGVLIALAKKVVENRADDISGSEELKGHIRNLKRSIMEEIRIQQSLQEIQGFGV
ncbi:unnamed protein product [Lactuca saligna]|uniref:U3 small nucleolar RNA-associated protein 15 C-terminal domain-containing protein n=1 Tax=Lactuca saligna TaxID=75948 RepID=A0AA35ZA11_LACSI|nr:unnamed protein product [Lactuca saligna]